MRKLKWLTTMLLVAMVMLLSVGCYIISGQKLSKVKGTYQLTSYTRTNGKTNAVIDYLSRDGYQAFLVVTGENEGYYVSRDNETEASYRKVSLTYTYSTEDSSKLEYVTYRFAGSDEQKLGVSYNTLNFSRPAIKLSETIYSDGLSMTWTRADKAVDLSYVQAQWGTVAEYSPVQSESAEN